MDIIALVGVIERHHEIRFKFFKIFSTKSPEFFISLLAPQEYPS